ncbi:MAG TPA: hypothetical protein PKE63_12975, partial [Lacibacter sp.]|nr:hypothetical protein [Lacibacter sp.]
MQANRKTIKNWAPDDRPREKLAANGPDVLSNAELIALLLGSGTRNQSALEVARQLLDRAQQSLGQLGKLSVKELTQVKGIGQARAITIAAALELGRRRQAADERRPVVKSSSDIARYLQAQLRD